MNSHVKETKEKMQKTAESIHEELNHIRTGRPSPAILDEISIEYYGNPTPLSQCASIEVAERSLVIKPWDRSIIKAIEKAILASPLGLTPMNDGMSIRLNFPPPTGEQKRELAKVAKDVSEHGKIAVRNIRRDVLKKIKEEQKAGDIPEDDAKKLEDEIQKLTDEFVKNMDVLYKEKESEILEV